MAVCPDQLVLRTVADRIETTSVSCPGRLIGRYDAEDLLVVPLDSHNNMIRPVAAGASATILMRRRECGAHGAVTQDRQDDLLAAHHAAASIQLQLLRTNASLSPSQPRSSGYREAGRGRCSWQRLEVSKLSHGTKTISGRVQSRLPNQQMDRPIVSDQDKPELVLDGLRYTAAAC